MNDAQFWTGAMLVAFAFGTPLIIKGLLWVADWNDRRKEQS